MDFNAGADVDAEHGLHMSSHTHQFNPPQNPNGTSFAATFRHMDHGLDSGASRNIHPSASPHLLTHDANGNIHQGHVSQNYYSDTSTARNALNTPSTPSQNASPRFSTLSPGQSRQIYSPSYVPQDRSLPDREVNNDGFDDAYASFILYCNPSFPTSIDTAELKKVFRSPPKSDGKNFNTFSLFELIKRFEEKDIKTWTELALELGVERPSVEKGQSSQKVQQYSVRLKRWMRALHIDAFFEYLMGKSHGYYRQIPPLSDPFPESRDGVPIEEDLAVRALDPKFRPKRGRRRADEQDDDMEPSSAIEPKRPHLDTSVSFNSRDSGYPHSAYPSSAIPMSAHPEELDRFVNGDPWSAAMTPASAVNARGNLSATQQQLRWRNETPSTPHPMSAMTPMSAHPDSCFDEPQSAVTPSSRMRPRRRHGPAVSSAWPSTNTTANGKLRGRPPSNRSVRDGPYVTFPANPRTKEGPTIDLSRNHITTGSGDQGQGAPSTATESPKPQFLTPQQPTPVSATSTSPLNRPTSGAPQSRPERLQLQVPPHIGGPVHLVTPTLLVNGQLSEPGSQSAATQTPGLSTASTARTMTSTSSFFGPPTEGTAVTDIDDHPEGHSFLTPKTSPQQERVRSHVGSPEALVLPILSNEDLKRALAADLLRGEIEGRSKRLRGTEAKELAESMLARLHTRHAPFDPGAESGAEHRLSRYTCANWLGLTKQLGFAGAAPTPLANGKKITVRRFRVGVDGYDSPMEEDDPLNDGDEIRETFDVEWSLSFGGITGKFTVKGLGVQMPGDEEEHDATPAGAKGDTWQERFLASERKVRDKDEELRRLRNIILDAVL